MKTKRKAKRKGTKSTDAVMFLRIEKKLKEHIMKLCKSQAVPVSQTAMVRVLLEDAIKRDEFKVTSFGA